MKNDKGSMPTQQVPDLIVKFEELSSFVSSYCKKGNGGQSSKNPSDQRQRQPGVQGHLSQKEKKARDGSNPRGENATSSRGISRQDANKQSKGSKHSKPDGERDFARPIASASNGPPPNKGSSRPDDNLMR